MTNITRQNKDATRFLVSRVSRPGGVQTFGIVFIFYSFFCSFFYLPEICKTEQT